MITLAPELGRLEQALAGLGEKAGPSVEAVHDVRVSCRRLDVFLRLAGRRALRGDLCWLRRALGPLRDLDVIRALELPLVRTVERRLAGERRRLGRTAAALATHERTAALLQGLRHQPPLGRKEAVAACARFEEALRRRPPARTFDALHDERRAVRRVRFAAEWLGRDTTELRERQAVLGVVCDLDAVRRFALELDDHQAITRLERAVKKLVRAVSE